VIGAGSHAVECGCHAIRLLGHFGAHQGPGFIPLHLVLATNESE
jgi:hypothetical protein